MMADKDGPAPPARRTKRAPRWVKRWLRTKTGLAAVILGTSGLAACSSAGASTGPVTLNFYQFPDVSGATNTEINNCDAQSHGAYKISYQLLPAASDSQRLQLVRRLAAHDCTIGRRQLAPQNAFRGPVADHVMHHQDEHMFARPQAHQSCPDSRLGLELVRTPRLIDQQTRQFRLALRGRQRAKVDSLHPQRPAFMHDCDRPFCRYLYGSPKNLVSRDDRVQRLLHRIGVEFSH